MEPEGIEPTGQAEGAATRAALEAAVAMCPKTPLRELLQPTDFTMVDIGETVGPITSVFGRPCYRPRWAMKSGRCRRPCNMVFGQLCLLPSAIDLNLWFGQSEIRCQCKEPDLPPGDRTKLNVSLHANTAPSLQVTCTPKTILTFLHGPSAI